MFSVYIAMIRKIITVELYVFYGNIYYWYFPYFQ